MTTGTTTATGIDGALPEGLDVITAPNPSPLTFQGTNTYLLGGDSVAVIDPGPALPAHFDAILARVAGRRVSHILVTHSHLDHSPLARPLAEATGAQVLAFGPSGTGRSPVMAALAQTGLAGGGEGIDPEFRPDQTLADGDVVEGDGWSLTALHTPGHLGNHLCFDAGAFVLSGDHIMGWATSLVSPPDGDLTDFMASCDRLMALGPRVLWPGHGGPVADGLARTRWIVAHRRAREAQILTCLARRPATVAEVTRIVYTDVAPALWPAAERNVFAHLIDLAQRNQVRALPALGLTARFERV